MEVRKVAEEWKIWDEEEEAAKSEEEAKKLVPERFHKWIKVFGKKQLERMPMRKLWDHAIEVKERFMPRKGKVYPLSREEREEVREFIKEQLRKGYIQPSKSPQTAPVFFVGKKDGKKRMVQDYRYLNEWTIKNNYPLPLISDVLENIRTKKLFTKMDLRWEYNNVRIKEGDEWKAAFTMLEGSFELTVMFFGLTNSPATFQAMMNKLLRDLINTGKIAVFIDDVIVVKIVDSRLYFIFLFSFFSFSIFRTARVRVDWSRCHISHKNDHKTWENLVEDSRTNDIIQYGHHILTSWTTHGCLG